MMTMICVRLSATQWRCGNYGKASASRVSWGDLSCHLPDKLSNDRRLRQQVKRVENRLGANTSIVITNIDTTGLALGQQLIQTVAPPPANPTYGWPNGAYITAIDPDNDRSKVSVGCYGQGTSTLVFPAGSATEAWWSPAPPD